MMERLRRTRCIVGAFLCLAGLAVGSAASERKSAESVVQVRCTLANGEMKATGFVWPKAGQIVTALHAVAGCAEIVVFSEVKPAETIATNLISVDLEADLALLQLEDDMGLPPVPAATEPPNTRGNFIAWGYPHAAEEMIDLKVQFGGGLKGGVTTIGSAFASRELNELFRTQSYPGRDTKILRVTTTIQPGHSGAPIFDENGGVVAIADGGLLGGWRTINWSIPAHVYLPGLPESTDPIPKEASSWAGLYSAVTPRADRPAAPGPLGAGPNQSVPDDGSVWLPEHSVMEGSDEELWQDPETTLDDESDLQIVRQITLGQALDYMRSQDETDPFIAEVEAALWDSYLLDDVVFDVYEDRLSGATVAVPSWMPLDWDDETGIAYAVNHAGTAHMEIAVFVGEDFQDTLRMADEFSYEIRDWAEWYDDDGPGAIPDEDVYPEDEMAVHANFHHGEDWETGQYSTLNLMFTVVEDVFLGSVVYLMGEPDEISEVERLEELMMLISAEYLTDFAVF